MIFIYVATTVIIVRVSVVYTNFSGGMSKLGCVKWKIMSIRGGGVRVFSFFFFF